MEINEIVSAIESLTLIQASELVKALEEKFGVSAAAPVAAAGVAGAPAAAAEEKTEFDVVLAGFDAAKKVAIIKAGIMDGAVQSVEEVKALADILPREQLIAKIMGCLNSQATALAYVIQAIADKKAEAGEQ